MNRLLTVAAVIAAIVVPHAARPAAAQQGTATSSKNLDAFYKSLPDVKHVTLDEALALTLMAMPLSCIDRPHVRPSGGGYLWEATYRPTDDYQRTRIFYGCYDWHSAANSMWSLVKSLKLFPKKATAGLIRTRLDKHLQPSNVAGEVEFFKQSGAFEVPYGLAWTLKLQGELLSWDDPDARRWATNLQPLVKLFSDRLTTYFKQLPQPVRTGVHPNSALGMNLMYDYRVAAALPAADPRALALKKLSAINAAQGVSAMHVPGYLGSHFIGAFSMLYLVSVNP